MDDETRLVPAQDESALTEKETAAVVPVTVDELAVKVLAALDMIAAVISDLRKPHPATAKKVRGARTVPHEAVSFIVAMVEATPVLQNVLPLDIDRAHEVLGSTDVYRLLGACRDRPPPPRTTQRRDGKAKEEAGVSGSPIATNRLQ